MNDLWMAVLLTIIVSVLTILVDWVVSILIVSRKTIQSVQNIVQAGLSNPSASEKITQEIDHYRSSLSSASTWGSDLATVTISLDFVGLGIWVHNPIIFPFISRFNEMDASYDIPIWLMIIGFHSILLLISMIFKHSHAETIACITLETSGHFPSKIWLSQNCRMILSNFIGFTSLLTGFILFTNAA